MATKSMTAAIASYAQAASVRKQRILGAAFLAFGLVILLGLARDTDPSQVSTLGLNTVRSVQVARLPDLVLPTQLVCVLLAVVVLAIGAWQAIKGFRSTGPAIATVSACLVMAFLVWAARGTSFSLIGILTASLQLATPILLGALSGILCERAGVINIAIEGMMLTAAFTSVIVANATGSIWLGLIAALISGVILAGWHAILSIHFKVNQIISGTVINIFATGFTNFLNQRVLQVYQQLNTEQTFPVMSNVIPALGEIPIIGPLFFDQGPFVWVALIMLGFVNVALYQTRWGLRTRSVGEHPKAADTLGIDVYRVRYTAVILGGLLAALGGAYFTLGSVGRFDKLMTGGRGFIALAAMVFGNWTPLGAFASSLIFGFADALQVKLQILISQVSIPSEFLLMLPYVVTMVVLAGVVGQATPPAADGEAYDKQ